MRLQRYGCACLAAAVLAGCGARLDDQQIAAATADRQRTAVVADGGPAGVGQATVGSGVGSIPTQDAGATADPAGNTAGEPGQDPVPTAPGGAACAPQPVDEVGVDDDSILLAQVATLSGPIPGLGQTAVNGVRAYVAYRNSIGGVCGRQLEVETGDDRLEAGQNRSQTARLAQRAFGLVGGWSAMDDGGANALEGTNVPDVGLAISDRRASLPNTFSSNPITAGESGALPILAHMVGAYGVRSAAVVWAASPSPRVRAQGFVRDLQALGVDVSVQREVGVVETNYVPVAQEIENRQIDLVITAMEITGIARLAQALQQVDYQPDVPFYGAQTYGPQFLELAGDAAEGTILGITHGIVEEADRTPVVSTFVDWYDRTNPGAPIDFFSFQGWVAADMLADAIEAAGPAPTRDAVLDVLRSTPTFDADGLAAPFDAAGKRNSTCFLIVQVVDGRWQRVHPSDGFACS